MERKTHIKEIPELNYEMLVSSLSMLLAYIHIDVSYEAFLDKKSEGCLLKSSTHRNVKKLLKLIEEKENEIKKCLT